MDEEVHVHPHVVLVLCVALEPLPFETRFRVYGLGPPKLSRYATLRGLEDPQTLLLQPVSRETSDVTTADSSQWLQRLPRRAYPQTILTGPYCRLVEIHAAGHKLARDKNILSVPDRPILLK